MYLQQKKRFVFTLTPPCPHRLTHQSIYSSTISNFTGSKQTRQPLQNYNHPPELDSKSSQLYSFQKQFDRNLDAAVRSLFGSCLLTNSVVMIYYHSWFGFHHLFCFSTKLFLKHLNKSFGRLLVIKKWWIVFDQVSKVRNCLLPSLVLAEELELRDRRKGDSEASSFLCFSFPPLPPSSSRVLALRIEVHTTEQNEEILRLPPRLVL